MFVWAVWMINDACIGGVCTGLLATACDALHDCGEMQWAYSIFAAYPLNNADGVLRSARTTLKQCINGYWMNSSAVVLPSFHLSVWTHAFRLFVCNTHLTPHTHTPDHSGVNGLIDFYILTAWLRRWDTILCTALVLDYKTRVYVWYSRLRSHCVCGGGVVVPPVVPALRVITICDACVRECCTSHYTTSNVWWTCALWQRLQTGEDELWYECMRLEGIF